MLEKAYVRYSGDLPNNPNTYAAADGFTQMGVRIVPFRNFEDISLENMPDLGDEAIVCGNIGDVLKALKLIGIDAPPTLDYPSHLDWLVKRNVVTTTLGQVRETVKPVFVKPIAQKLFTGLVFDPENPLSRLAVAVFDDEMPCLMSDVVNFVSEWRCFVRHHAVQGVKHYRGDWTKAPSADNLGVAMALGKSAGMPDAYAIDLGVVENPDTGVCHTELVEVNEGFALGAYGLSSVVYARFLETRWEQFVHNRSV